MSLCSISCCPSWIHKNHIIFLGSEIINAQYPCSVIMSHVHSSPKVIILCESGIFTCLHLGCIKYFRLQYLECNSGAVLKLSIDEVLCVTFVWRGLPSMCRGCELDANFSLWSLSFQINITFFLRGFSYFEETLVVCNWCLEVTKTHLPLSRSPSLCSKLSWST